MDSHSLVRRGPGTSMAGRFTGIDEPAVRVVGEASLRERVETLRFRIELPYERVGSVKRLVDAPGVRLVDESYGEAVCLVLAVEARRGAQIESALSDLGPAIRFRSRPAGDHW